MSNDWRLELERESNATLTWFVKEHSGFSIDAMQPQYRGGTNFITLGHYDRRL